MRKLTTIVATLITGAVVLTGCGNSNPCGELDRPSQAEIDAAAAGAEVEVEVDGNFGQEVECVVQRGDWVEDDED